MAAPGTLRPMLPRLGPLPVGERWCYEPKWDGFRALAFVDGRARLLSRRGNDLTHLCRHGRRSSGEHGTWTSPSLSRCSPRRFGAWKKSRRGTCAMLPSGSSAAAGAKRRHDGTVPCRDHRSGARGVGGVAAERRLGRLVCGWRWDVKTLSDPARKDIRLTAGELSPTRGHNIGRRSRGHLRSRRQRRGCQQETRHRSCPSRT